MPFAKHQLAIAACAAVLAPASAVVTAAPAAAQTMVTKITGIVGASNSPDSDTDTLGLFGPVNANLNGKTMQMTMTFPAALMNEGGASPGYSAWGGPAGTCAVIIGGVRAKPSIEKLVNIDSNRIYFYSNYQGSWGLAQYTQTSDEPDSCGIVASSVRHPFVPSAALVQSFHYKPPKKERIDDSILLDITVNGVRETVNANVTALKYGD